MKNRCGKSVVPISVLEPLIRKWAWRNEYSLGLETNWGDNGKATGIAVLSNDSGVPTRRIGGILNNSLGGDNVAFDTADKLLCAMGMNAEWHLSLAEYYEDIS